MHYVVAFMQVLAASASEPLRLTAPERVVMPRAVGAGFSQPVRMIMRDDGAGYLLDVRDAAVYRVARGTRIAARIGRVGAGPGEFERPGGIGVLADTLWVADVRLRRFTRFDGTGKTLETQQILLPPLPRPYVSSMAWALLRDGQAIGQTAVAGPSDSPNAPDARLIRFTVGTSQLDSSVRLSVRNANRTHQSSGGGVHITQPLSDATLWAAALDGSGYVVVDRPAAGSADAGTIRVDWYDASGQRARQYQVAYGPTRTPSGTRERFQAAFSSRVPIKIDPALWFVPEFLPPVTAIVLASDRSLWLRREAEGRKVVEWLRIELATGTVGRVELPASSSVLESRGQWVWVAEEDDDEPVVTRYTVARGGR